VRRVLDAIEAPVECNRVHGIMRKFFTWAVDVDLIEASPMATVKTPNPEASRDRALTDDELRAVWQAADKDGYCLGTIVQFLILCGQRRSEVSGMRWSELNDDRTVWTIPASRTKNKREHIVTLPRQCTDILRGIKPIGDRFVFTVSGHSAFNGWSRIKRLNGGVANWRPHDLRRTCATGMQRLGIRLEVTESALNHISGSRSGIVGIYQRHQYRDETAAALQQWADFVDRVVRS
jgi:integrase